MAPTCPQIPALLLMSVSWRGLPVPAQFFSAQMKAFKSFSLKGPFEPGVSVCLAMEGVRKMSYFSIANCPVAAGYGERAEHRSALAELQHHCKRILFYKKGLSPGSGVAHLGWLMYIFNSSSACVWDF